MLMVGAGGIGCELLKTLVLSGFSDIHIVSLLSSMLRFNVDTGSRFSAPLFLNWDSAGPVDGVLLVCFGLLVGSMIGISLT